MPDRTNDQVELNARLRRVAVRETFYWKEKTRDGAWVRLLTIRVSFNTECMIGIEFLYESGISRQLGSRQHLKGGVCTSYELDLEADEEVVLLITQIGNDVITDIGVSFIKSFWPSSTNKASNRCKRIEAKLSTLPGLQLPGTQKLPITPSTWSESRCLLLQLLPNRLL